MKKFLTTIFSLICVFSMSAVNVSAEENNVLYGDANCDGKIDICDITSLKQHLIGIEKLSEQGIKNCDFFCNNEITVQSLLNINNHIIKTIDSLEPLTYYQITNEEVQEYIKKYSIPDRPDEIEGILFEITDTEKFNTAFDLYSLGLPENNTYIHEFPKEWKLIEIAPKYLKNPESLARILYCIEKKCDYLQFYIINYLEG